MARYRFTRQLEANDRGLFCALITEAVIIGIQRFPTEALKRRTQRAVLKEKGVAVRCVSPRSIERHEMLTVSLSGVSRPVLLRTVTIRRTARATSDVQNRTTCRKMLKARVRRSVIWADKASSEHDTSRRIDDQNGDDLTMYDRRHAQVPAIYYYATSNSPVGSLCGRLRIADHANSLDNQLLQCCCCC